MLAMTRAFEALKLSSKELLDCHVLVDGNQKIRGFNYKQTPVVKGDQKIKAISAASIVAKVARDHLMTKLSEDWVCDVYIYSLLLLLGLIHINMYLLRHYL